MKKAIIILTGCAAVTLSACYKNDLETLSGTVGCNTTNISYANDVKVMISTNCAVSGCHDAGAATTFTLTSYDDVKTIADDGRFLKSIRHDQGVSAMPKSSSKLSQCNIDKVASWIQSGALNN